MAAKGCIIGQLAGSLAQTISWIIAISLFSYTAAGLTLFLMQGKMIYQPDDQNLADCTLPEGAVFWQQNDEQGILSAAGNDKLLIFFHGNADSACNWRYLGVNHLNPLGYDVLVMEYPGYGGDARPPGKGLIEDMIVVSNAWVVAENYTETVVMGYSLGTGAASIYAAQFGADAVILFAPYDSIYEVARGQGIDYPRFLLTEDFDNITSLSDVDAPISIVHGALDQVIPASHSANLATVLQANGRDVTRRVLPNTGHTGLFETPFFDTFLTEILTD